MDELTLNQVPLGKKSTYISQYNADLLVGVPRSLNRAQLPIENVLPFSGVDLWNGYELSWLNRKNKPQVALGQFIFTCDSEYLVESKSFKLYLNSFNNTQFVDIDEVQALLEADLGRCTGKLPRVHLFPVNQQDQVKTGILDGVCIDDLDVLCDFEQVNPQLLQVDPSLHVDEVLVSHLLKSNCLVTGQPDWGSVQICYRGLKIDHAGLLQYIVSFRNHNEFHEHCVERIFMDILERCAPESLTVYARYTRRGGLDINPLRSTDATAQPQNIRLIRQ